jgi:hypothetical protein
LVQCVRVVAAVESFIDIARPAGRRNDFSRKFNFNVKAFEFPTIFFFQHAFGGQPTVKKPRRRLFIAGRILHIARKKTDGDRKPTNSFEMRWATPEDFLEMKVMPRMMLDHFPHNILKTLTTILKDRKSDSILSIDKI